MGCGKNGTFDIKPDLHQWAILVVTDKPLKDLKSIYGRYITNWWKFFGSETWTIILEPIQGHGTWDNKNCFGNLPKQTNCEGSVAVLTRATIRMKKLKAFWGSVNSVADKMNKAEGFVFSAGIGEVPWIKQATFSIWKSKSDMKSFAYKMQEHAEVITKTRKENWYREEMFIQFKPLQTFGTINGANPFRI